MNESIKQWIAHLRRPWKYMGFPPIAEIPFLEEADVNERNIARILESSGAKVRMDEDGQLCVNYDGRCINIFVWNNSKIIQLISISSFKADAKLPQIQQYVNRLNTRTKLVKYALFSNNADISMLSMSYCLPYALGVARDQLISVVAMFDAYAFDAALLEDDDDILK